MVILKLFECCDKKKNSNKMKNKVTENPLEKYFLLEIQITID